MAKKSAKAEKSSTSSKRKVSPSGALKKGKQFERDIANMLSHIFPEAQRMLEYQASKVIGVDIEGTDIFKIQCKNHQGYVSIGTISEIRGLREGDIPVLVSKGNSLEAMAVFPFRDFVRLLESAYGLAPLLKNVNEKLIEAPVFEAPKLRLVEAEESIALDADIQAMDLYTHEKIKLQLERNKEPKEITEDFSDLI